MIQCYTEISRVIVSAKHFLSGRVISMLQEIRVINSPGMPEECNENTPADIINNIL